MPIPFPGMNPYLEHPELWPQVHRKLMNALAETLEQQLADRYPDRYEVRSRQHYYHVSGEDSLVVGSPGLNWGNASKAQPVGHDCQQRINPPQPLFPATIHGATQSGTLPISAGQSSGQSVGYSSAQSAGQSVGQSVSQSSAHNTSAHNASAHSAKGPISVLVPVPQRIYETYLEVVEPDGEVVTVIEALSPKKKRHGRGRVLYERQREAIFGSDSHFVEIDLLRGWEPPSIYGPEESGDYRMLISRSEQRPRAQLYTWHVMETIPLVALPLSGHDELPLDLKAVVDRACDRTDLLVNYQQNPLPPLRHNETLWLERFLQEVGMRPCAS
ncbi:MAG: DUF4058 family protein [Cyanobacteria bacterium J06634_5]